MAGGPTERPPLRHRLAGAGDSERDSDWHRAEPNPRAYPDPGRATSGRASYRANSKILLFG